MYEKRRYGSAHAHEQVILSHCFELKSDPRLGGK